jgi:hypothetical protein
MKCLINHFGNGIIMDNVVLLEWCSIEQLSEKQKSGLVIEGSTAAILATDINKNQIVLGEYLFDGHASLVVMDIMAWLADPTTSEVYLIESDECLKPEESIYDSEVLYYQNVIKVETDDE